MLDWLGGLRADGLERRVWSGLARVERVAKLSEAGRSAAGRWEGLVLDGVSSWGEVGLACRA